jgi:hypothetical protein
MKCLFHLVIQVFQLFNCLKQGQFAVFWPITAMESRKSGYDCPEPMGVKISTTALFSDFTGGRCENHVDGDCGPTTICC